MAKRRQGSQPPAPEDGANLRLAYFDLATQYYVIGRGGYHAYAHPVAANIFHHAIELYIKGYLARVGVIEAERIDMGHDLKSLWARLRQHAPDPALGAFDNTIAALNLFEELRYPESPLRKYGDSEMVFGPRPTQATVRKRPLMAKPTGQFYCDIAEIDRLVIALHHLASVNPLRTRLSASGLAMLGSNNANAADWH